MRGRKSATPVEKRARAESFPRQLTALYLALMLSAFLLCFGPNGYLDITDVKYRAFCTLTIGYLVLLAAGAGGLLLARRLSCPPLKSLLRGTSRTQRFLACYLLFTLLSWLCSPWRAQSFVGLSRHEGFLTISLYCLMFFAVSSFFEPKKWLVPIFGVSMTLFAAISLLQIAGIDLLRLFPDGVGYQDSGTAYVGAYLGTVGNVDLVAALLCIAIPVFFLSVCRGSGSARFFLLIPLALCAALLAAMNVSAGIVGVCGGLLLTIPFAVKPSHRNYALASLAVLLLGSLLAVFGIPGLPGMLGEAHELLHGNFDDSFGSGRILIWKSVLEQVPERPLLGGGPDTLAARITTVFERYDAEANIVYQAGIDAAHNEYLNILACQGAPALLAYLGALASALAAWWRRPGGVLTPAAGGAVLCYCVQAFFGISMCMTAPFFWIALAVLDAAANRDLEVDSL